MGPSRGNGSNEATWLRAHPAVAPEILGVTTDGYIMEELQPAPLWRGLPDEVYRLLLRRVWSHRPLNADERLMCVSPGGVWFERIQEIFGVSVPLTLRKACWIQEPCHGDPTFSNVMMKEIDGRERLRLIDPCHREYCPEHRLVDCGKILQSMLGWETVQLGWQPPEPWNLPEGEEFASGENDGTKAYTLWWCGLHCTRILRREKIGRNREEVITWAEHTAEECLREAGL